MALPTPTANRLRAGHPVAAEVMFAGTERRAWIFVQPLARATKGYKVRYVELSDWHLAHTGKWEFHEALLERPVPDLEFRVCNDEELERLLAEWHLDATLLKAPGLADYPNPPRFTITAP